MNMRASNISLVIFIAIFHLRLFSHIRFINGAAMSDELTKATENFGESIDPFLEDCKLIPFLSTLPGRNILYIRNQGTAGDALIEEGTFSIFRKLGLTWDICCDNINKHTELDVIMYAGLNRQNSFLIA
jgi:hypothetical protein